MNDAPLFVDIMNSFLIEKKLSEINIALYREFFEFPIINYYRRLGFNFKEESFRSLGVRFIDTYKQRRFEAALFCGVGGLIKKLNQKGCLQFVVSAQENSLLRSAVEYYNLSHYFTFCSGVDNVFAEGKVCLANKLKNEFLSDIKNVFVVGDSLKDLDVALALKAVPLLVSYGHCAKHRLVGKGSSFIFDSVGALDLFLSKQIKTIN